MAPISYTSIPHVKPYPSPWHGLKIASGFTFGIGAVVALGIPLSHITGISLDTTEAMLGGIMLAVLIGMVIRALWSALNASRAQVRRMMRFATTNGWTFSGELAAPDSSMLPPTAIIQLDNCYMRYKIYGQNNKGAFELYLLKGVVRRSPILGSGHAFGFLTVIRTSYPLASQQLEEFHTVNQDGYGYAVHTGNALNRETLEQLFALI